MAEDRKQLHIGVKGKIATLESRNFELVGGNSDYEVVFDFDEDWANYPVKTALFVYGNDTKKVVFDGNICKGVAVKNATICFIGVYADDIATTTPACVSGIRQSIRDIATDLPEAPEEDVYNQIMELLNRYLNAVKGAPSGGLKGQVLKKNSDKDYDYSWQDDVAGNGDINVDQKYNPNSENAQSGIAVSQAIAEIPKEIVNITTIDQSYNTVEDLYKITNASNGMTVLVNSEQSLYSYDGTKKVWNLKAKLRPHTAYIVLSGEKSGIYRYTMSAPYLVSAEENAVGKAKAYTDTAIKNAKAPYQHAIVFGSEMWVGSISFECSMSVYDTNPNSYGKDFGLNTDEGYLENPPTVADFPFLTDYYQPCEGSVLDDEGNEHIIDGVRLLDNNRIEFSGYDIPINISEIETLNDTVTKNAVLEAANNYTDEKIGDIESALESIIAVQNTIIGEVTTS